MINERMMKRKREKQKNEKCVCVCGVRQQSTELMRHNERERGGENIRRETYGHPQRTKGG